MRIACPQSVELPADHQKPDGQENAVDDIANAENGSETLAKDAQHASYYAQVGGALREDAFEHEQRDDQDANGFQNTHSCWDNILREKALGGSREGGALYGGGSRRVLVAQVDQGGRSAAGCRPGQCERPGDDADEGSYGGEALIQMLECHRQRQEDDHGEDAWR